MSFEKNRWVLAGITSHGNKCARAGYPGIYTRLSAFMPFIESIQKGIYPPATTPSKTNSISVCLSSLFFNLFVIVVLLR